MLNISFKSANDLVKSNACSFGLLISVLYFCARVLCILLTIYSHFERIKNS